MAKNYGWRDLLNAEEKGLAKPSKNSTWRELLEYERGDQGSGLSADYFNEAAKQGIDTYNRVATQAGNLAQRYKNKGYIAPKQYDAQRGATDRWLKQWQDTFDNLQSLGYDVSSLSGISEGYQQAGSAMDKIDMSRYAGAKDERDYYNKRLQDDIDRGEVNPANISTIGPRVAGKAQREKAAETYKGKPDSIFSQTLHEADLRNQAENEAAKRQRDEQLKKLQPYLPEYPDRPADQPMAEPLQAVPYGYIKRYERQESPQVELKEDYAIPQSLDPSQRIASAGSTDFSFDRPQSWSSWMEQVQQAATPAPGRTGVLGRKAEDISITGGIIRGNTIHNLQAEAQEYYETTTSEGAKARTSRLQAQHDELMAQRNRVFQDISDMDRALGHAPSPQDVEAYFNYVNTQVMRPKAAKTLEGLDKQLSDLNEQITNTNNQVTILELKDNYKGFEDDPIATQKFNADMYKAKFGAEWDKMSQLEKVGIIAGDAAKMGMYTAAGGWYALSDIMGDVLGMPKNEWSQLNKELRANLQSEMTLQAQKMGPATEKVQALISATVDTIPAMVMAVLSGGASVAATAKKTLATAGQGLWAGVRQSALEMFKSPNFIFNLLSEGGRGYEEERAKGYNPTEAAVNASLKAFPNAMIEQGGLQSAMQRPNVIKELVRTGLEEGGEEITQGTVGNAYDFIRSGKIMQPELDDIISWDNPEAVIAGKKMLEEGAMGAAVGGILGGTQAGVRKIGDAVMGGAEPAEVDWGDYWKKIDAEQDAQIAAKQQQEATAPVVKNVATTVKEVAERLSLDTAAADKLNADLAASKLDEVTFSDAYARAYEAGIEGIDAVYLTASDAVKKLSPDLAKTAYEAGIKAYEGKNKPKLLSAAAAARMSKLKPGEGKITYHESVDKAKLLPYQKKQIEIWDTAARVLGLNAVMFQSATDAEGNIVAGTEFGLENGKYEYSTGRIWIDVNAQKKNIKDNAQAIILKTAGHELAHFLKHMSPDLYREYSRAVTQALANAGQNIDTLINEQIARSAAGSGGDIGFDVALEEVIANTSDLMLRDSQVINNIRETSPDLFARMHKWVKDFAQRVRDAFERFRGTESVAQKAIMQGVEGVLRYSEDLVAKFDAALGDAAGIVPANETMARPPIAETAKEAAQAKSVIPADAELSEGSDAIPQNGNNGRVFTNDNTEVAFHYALVPAGSVVASNTTDFAENPAYPQDMQPRERADRDAYRWQVENIAKQLNPARLGASPEVNSGAPMVGPDMLVENGNGRTIALQMAIEKNGEQAKKYNEWLRKNAAMFGLSADDVKPDSILVRVNDSNLDRNVFAEKGNEPVGAQYSASETAKIDARKLTPALLRKFDPSKDYDSAANGEFARGFISAVLPEADLNEFIGKDGRVSQTGVERMRNALFQLAYNDGNMTARLSEATEGTIKNIVNAMVNVAPRIALTDENIKAGQLHGSSIAKPLVEAYTTAKSVQASGQTVEVYVNQTAMVPKESPEAFALLEMFAANRRSGRAITSAIKAILDRVEMYGDPNQVQLPGMETVTPSTLQIIREGIADAQAREDAGVRFQERDDNGVLITDKYPNLNLNEDISSLDGVPAIRLIDGSILPAVGAPTHVNFITKNNIDVADVHSGGWISKGIYDPSFTSETSPYILRELAKRRRDAGRGVLYQERDSDNTPLSPEQIEYFKDSKVRDEQGRLLKVYHGTKAWFTMFRTSDGAYFTASKKIADGFAGDKGAGAYYLNMKAPYVLDAKENRYDALTAPAEMGRTNALYEMTADEKAQLSEFRKLQAELQAMTDADVPRNERLKWYDDNPRHGELFPIATKIIQKQASYEEAHSDLIAVWDLAEWVKEQGKYDGIILKNVREGWSSEIVSDDYIALSPEQIKSTDNLAPTSSPDIRFQERDSDNTPLSPEQIEYFKDSKVRDGDGKLIPVYHGTRDTFTVFSKDRRGTNTKTAASNKYFFAGDRATAESYSPYHVLKNLAEIMPQSFSMKDADAAKGKGGVMPLYLLMRNPLEADVIDYDWAAHRANADALIEYVEEAERNGNDGLIFHHVPDNNLKAGQRSSTIYLFKESEQAKSVDNLTPTTSPDIRYQERTDDPTSAREILSAGFEQIAVNDVERSLLKTYQGRVKELNAMEQAVVDARTQIQAIESAEGFDPKAPNDRLIRLKNNVKTLTDKINRADKKLLKFEKAAPLKNVLDREVKKVQERQSEIRRQQLTEYREARATTDAKRKLRDQIIRGVKKLNDLLVNESDKRHIPERLKGVVIEFMQPFLQDTSVFYAAQLDRLRDVYEAIGRGEHEGEADMQRFFDEDLAGDLRDMALMLDGRRLSQLTEAELETVLNVVSNLDHMIINENSIIIAGRREEISGLSNAVKDEHRGKAKDKRLALLNGNNPVAMIVKMLSSQNIKPVYFFKNLGGVMKRLFDDIRREGQSRYGLTLRKSREYFIGIAAKHHYWDWAAKKGDTLKIKTAIGDDIELTREQALSLYAISKREKTNIQQKASHLKEGGFVFTDAVQVTEYNKGIPVKYTVNTAETHPLNETDVEQITQWLTNEQRAFADDMVAYLSTEMADLGNEASMKLYGIRKYLEKYYFPYKSSQNFLYRQQGQGALEGMQNALRHRSFTKRTVQFANNPIVLDDFTKTWGGHVESMVMYNSMVVPLENFNRVYNYRDRGAATQGIKPESVKSVLQAAYGRKANEYIEQLIDDLNGGVRPPKTEALTDKMIGLFKKGAVFANLSVVVQQPSAIMRAMALIDPKHFLRSVYTKADNEEMLEYSGVAVLKEMGRFDVGLGMGSAEWITRQDRKQLNVAEAITDKDTRDDMLAYLPRRADEITWTSIWRAVKNEIAAEGKHQRGTPEFMAAVTERFEDVIDYTQVYDSVLARSEMMRAKSGMMKSITAFMSEPTTSYNMLYDAFANRADKGRKDHVAPARALAAFTASIVLNSLLKALVMAARDDDENKTYVEKYVNSAAEGIIDGMNPVGMVPIFRDILSIVQGYDVNRADMALITDLYRALDKANSDRYTGLQKIEGIVGAAAAFLGVPVKNVWRDGKGIYNLITTNTPISATTGAGIKNALMEALPGYDTTLNAYYRRLYDAINDGDMNRQAELTDVLTRKGKEQKTIDAGLRKLAREAAIEGAITPSKAMEQLSRFGVENLNGDIKDLYDANVITREEADALLLEYSIEKMDDAAERYKTITKWDYDRVVPEGEKSDYRVMDGFLEAVKTGKNLRAVVTDYTNPEKYGYEKSYLADQITEAFKPEYIKVGKRERASMKGYLLNAYVMLGYDREDRSKAIDKWLKP